VKHKKRLSGEFGKQFMKPVHDGRSEQSVPRRIYVTGEFLALSGRATKWWMARVAMMMMMMMISWHVWNEVAVKKTDDENDNTLTRTKKTAPVFATHVYKCKHKLCI